MQHFGISRHLPRTTPWVPESIWANVSNLKGAEAAARIGMWNSFLLAGMVALTVPLGLATRTAFIDALLYVPIGIGIRKMSRIAAVAGLVLYVGEQLAAYAHLRFGDNIVWNIIFIGVFLRATRAAFRHRGFRANENATKES